MSVIALCGLPGSGKTFYATYLMRQHYKKENNIFKRLFFKKKIFNNVYSNYPIKLDRNHYSNSISLDDLNFSHSYKQDSDVVLDEAQSYYDSLEYKDFPKEQRNFFQFHRHFGIKDIFVISQDPSRIPKQIRALCCEFYDITRKICIPILGICFLRFNVYYKNDDFGKSVQVKRTEVPYKFKKCYKFFFYKKVYKSYDTKYMSKLLEGKEIIKNKEFNNRSLTKDDIYKLFNVSES